jgi:hypothetical protein
MMETDGGAQSGARWTEEHLRGALDVVLHGGLYARNQAREDILSEHERLAAQVAALTAERDQWREERRAYHLVLADLRQLEAAARCVVTHHDRNECAKLDAALAALDATTTPLAGAQEIAPEESEPMEQCEWCGRQCPHHEMNDVPWPDDEHTRRICDRCVDDSN